MRIDVELTELQEKWVEKEIKRLNKDRNEIKKVTKREVTRRLFEAARKGDLKL